MDIAKAGVSTCKSIARVGQAFMADRLVAVFANPDRRRVFVVEAVHFSRITVAMCVRGRLIFHRKETCKPCSVAWICYPPF